MLLRGSIKESREREREKEGGKAAKKESTDMEDIGIDPKERRRKAITTAAVPIINRNIDSRPILFVGIFSAR